MVAQNFDSGRSHILDEISRLLEGPPTVLLARARQDPGLKKTLLDEIHRRQIELASDANSTACCMGLVTLATMAEAIQDSSIDPLLKGRRILYVEDDLSISNIAQSFLVEAGAEVTVANSFAVANYYIGLNRYDVVITDVSLGDGNGFDLLKVLIEKPPLPRIIVSTGFGYDPDHVMVNMDRHLDELGQHRVSALLKPFRMSDLIERVREELERLPRQAAA